MIILQKVLRIIIFIFIIIILDSFIGYSLKKLYFSQKGGLYYRTTYSIDSTNADVLVFGASTANHHYNPDVFENRFRLSFYSTGRDGMSIYYFLAIQEAILQRYKPKLIILDFNINSLFHGDEDFDKLSGLLPYYEKTNSLDSIILLRNPLERIKLFSKIYPYNSTILTLLKGKSIDNSDRGFVKNDNIMNPNDFKIKSIDGNEIKSKEKQVDSNKINALKQFIINCKMNNINVIVVSPPRYYHLNNANNSYQSLLKICDQQKIFFFDYSKNKYSGEDFYQLYADPGHLNNNGAKVFSNDLCDSIVNYNLLER